MESEVSNTDYELLNFVPNLFWLDYFWLMNTD